MEGSGRRQDRLLELALEAGVTQSNPRIDLPVASTIAVTPEDIAFVQEALARTRLLKFESKNHLLRRSPSKASPKAKEITETLRELLVGGSCSAGHAQILLEKGADVNLTRHKSGSIVKRIRKKEQEDVRSNLFQTAVGNGDRDLIEALAKRADQQSLNEGLEVALREKDLEAMKVVMRAGADPNVCDQQFNEAVRDGNTEVVCILSSGTIQITGTTATNALTHAVTSGQLESLRLLLWHGADSNHDRASAFLQAANSGKRDLISAFCLTRQHPSPAYLAHAVKTVSSGDEMETDDLLRIIETFLAAGAAGNEVSESLVRATENRKYQLVDLFVRYIDYNEDHSTVAMKHAISAGDVRLFQSLIKTGQSPHVLDSLISHSLTTRQDVAYEARVLMLNQLVKCGATKQSISVALIDALTNDELDVAKFLMQQGASPDLNDGEALRIAVQHKSIELLTILLSGRPNNASLISAFTVARDLRDADSRFEIMEVLLIAGVRGDPVHQALVEAMEEDANNRNRFTKLLLDKGEGSVNFEIGESLSRAVRQQDISVLRLLIRKEPSPESMDRAITDALTLSQSATRLRICEILLKRGLQDLTRNKGLVSAVRTDECDLELVRLLLSFDASIDFDSGNALRASVIKQDAALLSLLLTRPAQPKTLCTALAEVLNIKAEEKKFEFAAKVFDSSTQFAPEDLGELLPQTFNNSTDTKTLHLFLSKGASLDYNKAEALQKAVAKGHITGLELMLQFSPSLRAVRRTFARAWAIPHQSRLRFLKIIAHSEEQRNAIDMSAYLVKALKESPRSHILISFLLSKEASVEHSNSESLQEAVGDLDHTVLKILLEKAKSRQGVSEVFSTVVRDEKTWNSHAGLECVSLLLEHGAFGPILDEAMLRAVEKYDSHEIALLILNELIRHSASPDFENGRSLEIAAKTANYELLEKLFQCGPSVVTVNRAFPYLLLSGAEEETILLQINLFWQYFGGKIDLNVSHDQLPPILFLCMQQYPHSVSIIRELLQRGADVSKEVNDQAEDSGPENVNTLLWAIKRGSDNEIIDELLVAGANVKFKSSSGNTPLLAAVKRSRSHVVRKLLEVDCDASDKDLFNRSVLFYATRNEDLGIMDQLIEAGAPSDDGSIQEAAREGSAVAVEVLLRAKHDPNHASRLHDMRSCLEEMVTQRPNKPQEHHKLKATIEALVRGGASIDFKRNEKSILILGLDAVNASVVTAALLGAFMKDFINNKFNEYKHNGYVYSPLSYVIEGMQQSSSSEGPALIQILQSYGCKKKFYHEDGPQPIGFTPETAPDDVVEEDRRQKARSKRLAEEEEEARIRQQRRRDETAEAQRIEQQLHVFHMQQDRERANEQLQLERNRNVEQERFAEHRRIAEVEQRRTLDNQRLSTLRQENKLQIELKQGSALIDQGVIDAGLNADRQREEMRRITLKEEDRISAAQNNRNMKEIEAKRAGTKEQSRLLDKQKELAQLTNSYQQRQITYEELD